MPPVRLRVAAVTAVLGVALFSATPALRWCSIGWADVRPECLVPMAPGVACGADAAEAGVEGDAASSATASAACPASPSCPAGSASCSASSAGHGADAVTVAVDEPGRDPNDAPEVEPTPAPATPEPDAPREPETMPTPPGKRAFCPDGSAGGDGEPGPAIEKPDPPARAAVKSPIKTFYTAIAPELRPFTVHRVRPPRTTGPPRPAARADQKPATPRAPPKNIHLFGWF